MDVKSRKIFGLIFIISILLMIFTFLSNSFPTRISTTKTSTPSPTSQPKFEVTIPSKGLLKNYVTVSVKAESGTICNLIFIPASGEMLNMDTIADKNGDCVWRWKLEESYGRGSARLIFTIEEMSQTHFLQILPEF
ncbi:MAG: hypothetical protein JNJ43_00510 [Anaerolineales bacterium]|nr:hypothetical protein [Anaerolineales bacterium]